MRYMVRAIGGPAVVAAILLMLVPGAALAQKTGDEPGWLGVSIQDLTEDLRDALPRGVHEGAMVNDVVEGSPAEKAGLKEGDIITRLGRERIGDTDDLTRAVREAGAGHDVTIEYYRDGRRMRTEATLTPRAEADTMPRAQRRYRDAMRWYERQRDSDDEDSDEPDSDVYFFGDGMPGMIWGIGNQPARLGVHLMDLGEQLATYFKVSKDDGPLVTEVVEDSPAAKAGIKAGDIIARVGDDAVEDAGDVRDALRDHDEAGPVEIEVVRNGRRQTMTAQLAKAEPTGGRRFGILHRPEAPRGEMYRPPRFDWNQDDFRAQMKDLKKQLEELRRELDDMRRNRP